MGQNYRLLVFDWDGTLLDSASAIVACMQAAARDLGLQPPDPRIARDVIGLGLQDALSRALPDLPVAQYSRVSQTYRQHYLSRDHELSLFEGVHEMIEELADSGFLLAIATGKSRVGLNRGLAHSGLGRYFHSTRCADECPSKPAPDMLIEIMAELEVDDEQTLMIGDTSHDLRMARNARVGALAVGYGAHTREALLAERPLGLFDDAAQLASWLRTNG